MRARVRAPVCVRVRACMHARACLRDVFAIYDNNISPRLRMIIIKISILYFIQIRHADDFPSTGTRRYPASSFNNVCTLVDHGSMDDRHIRSLSGVLG